jgi:hypothetical protein
MEVIPGRPGTGIPVRDYVGETLLTRTDAATDILWTVTLTHAGPARHSPYAGSPQAMAKGLARQSELLAHPSDRPDA